MTKDKKQSWDWIIEKYDIHVVLSSIMGGLTEKMYNQWLAAEYGILAGEGVFAIGKVFQAGGIEQSFSLVTELQLAAFLAFLTLALASGIARTRIGRPSTRHSAQSTD